MLQRERYIRTLTFQAVDRPPLVEWPIRTGTMNAWLAQGYPKGVEPARLFGLDTLEIGPPIQGGMLPAFEETILEDNGQYRIWQDALGAVRKDFSADSTPGFVTRSWLKFAVEGWQDFAGMQKRYDAANPARYEELTVQQADILNKGPVPVHLAVPYLFWTARDWMGFENLCCTFYDDPALIDAMFSFIAGFTLEVLRRVLDKIHLDSIELKEDMAYKHAPMISPEMFRRHMLPHYIKLVDFVKSKGVDVVFVDCDGYPGGLIPLWIQAGVDGMSPCEIAAGNDMLALRREYSHFALLGGIDKRELAKDRRAVYNEVMGKVPQLLEKGGYIPHTDHAVPPDVPLSNYLYYRELLARLAYGEPVPQP